MARHKSWKRQASDRLRPRDIDMALSVLRPFDSFLLVEPNQRQMLRLVERIRSRHSASKDRFAWAWVEGGIRVWRIL